MRLLSLMFCACLERLGRNVILWLVHFGLSTGIRVHCGDFGLVLGLDCVLWTVLDQNRHSESEPISCQRTAPAAIAAWFQGVARVVLSCRGCGGYPGRSDPCLG